MAQTMKSQIPAQEYNMLQEFAQQLSLNAESIFYRDNYERPSVLIEEGHIIRIGIDNYNSAIKPQPELTIPNFPYLKRFFMQDRDEVTKIAFPERSESIEFIHVICSGIKHIILPQYAPRLNKLSLELLEFDELHVPSYESLDFMFMLGHKNLTNMDTEKQPKLRELMLINNPSLKLTQGYFENFPYLQKLMLCDCQTTPELNQYLRGRGLMKQNSSTTTPTTY